MKKRYVDETAGIYLRPLSYDDTDLIVAWRNSDAVRRNFIYQELFTREGHEAWIKNRIDTGQVVQTIICDLGTDTPLGSVYIRDIDRRHNKAEYGIFIGEPSARGRGVGTAAARLMLRYCFEEEGLHRIYLRAFSGNVPALRSYEKAGFVKEACLKDDVRIDGKYCDIIWMAAINPTEDFAHKLAGNAGKDSVGKIAGNAIEDSGGGFVSNATEGAADEAAGNSGRNEEDG